MRSFVAVMFLLFAAFPSVAGEVKGFADRLNAKIEGVTSSNLPPSPAVESLKKHMEDNWRRAQENAGRSDSGSISCRPNEVMEVPVKKSSEERRISFKCGSHGPYVIVNPKGWQWTYDYLLSPSEPFGGFGTAEEAIVAQCIRDSC